MPIVCWTAILCALLLSCLLSFAWAMKHFFTQPTGTSLGMSLIKFSGAAFGLTHLSALALLGAAGAERAALAALAYAASLALFWWTLSTHQHTPISAVFSRDLPHRVVQDGPYRFVRHPFYASYLLMWLAAPIGAGQWWLATAALIMGGVYYSAAKSEEKKFAESAVANHYARYRAATGLFLPNPLKMLQRFTAPRTQTRTPSRTQSRTLGLEE